MRKKKYYFSVVDAGFICSNDLPKHLKTWLKCFHPLMLNDAFHGLSWRIDEHQVLMVRPSYFNHKYDFELFVL